MVFMLVSSKLRTIKDSYHYTLTNVSLANGVGTIIILLCLFFYPCSSTLAKSDCCRITSMSRNNAFPHHRYSLYAHLLTTIAHKVRSVFYNCAILIGHSHAININIALRPQSNRQQLITIIISRHFHKFTIMTTIRLTSITEYSGLPILLHKILTQLLIITFRHNRRAGVGEADHFVIYSFALPKLSFKSLRVLLTKLIRTIITAIIIVQYSAASATYITPIVDGLTIATEQPILESALIPFEYRQITSSL